AHGGAGDCSPIPADQRTVHWRSPSLILFPCQEIARQVTKCAVLDYTAPYQDQPIERYPRCTQPALNAGWHHRASQTRDCATDEQKKAHHKLVWGAQIAPAKPGHAGS